jgi:hypothetical protein
MSEAASVPIRDHLLWIGHIEPQAGLAAHLGDLRAGSLVALEINGVVGIWRKARDGSDGRPTHALRPEEGATKDFWEALLKTDRGSTALIALAG